jgi:hypothetical protein
MSEPNPIIMTGVLGIIGGTAVATGTALLTTINPGVGFIAGATTWIAVCLPNSENLKKIIGKKANAILRLALAALAAAGLTKLACDYALHIPLTFKASLQLSASGAGLFLLFILYGYSTHKPPQTATGVAH